MKRKHASEKKGGCGECRVILVRKKTEHGYGLFCENPDCPNWRFAGYTEPIDV